MTDSTRTEDLLGDQLDRALASYLVRLSFSVPRGGNAQWARRTSSGTRRSNSIEDNERAMRALAKEIKRLIIEDKRRGIGI